MDNPSHYQQLLEKKVSKPYTAKITHLFLIIFWMLFLWIFNHQVEPC
jgi:hypothetical protein